MRIIVRAALVALLAAGPALSGCGGEGEPGPAPADRDITGEYVVTAVTDSGSPHALVTGSELRITLRDGTLALHAGCNHLSGSYTLDGDELRVGMIGGTEMGCPKPLMEQDTWLAGLFGGVVNVGHDPLTFTSGDVVLTLTPRKEVSPDRPLSGTAWTLDGIIDGEAVSSVPAGPAVVLEVGTGSATITGLCTGWGAEVEIADGTVTWTPGMRRLVACDDPARQRLDTTVSEVLTGPTSYEIEERTLTIRHGKQGLTFRAE